MKNTKSLVIQGASFFIGQFVQNVNKDILEMENNARDLALLGELQYNSSGKREVFEYITTRIFENYSNSLGGGIWFKPEIMGRLYCVYAYRNKDKQIIIDKRFETFEYNYPNQNWYKEITSKLTKENNIAWSLPYFEYEGSNTFMVTAGSGIYDNNELVGITTVDWELDSIIKSIQNLRITPNSFALFADEKNDYVIVSTDPYMENIELTGKTLKHVPWYKENLRKITYIDYHNKKYLPYVKTLDNGMCLIVCVPKNELFYFIFMQVSALFASLIIISLIISTLLYMGLNRNIIKPINVLVDIANKISKGNLDLAIKIKKPEEFAHLASTFDKMTKEITAITKQREKIEAGLTLAKSIQSSSLPNVFPPYPDRYDFDIYASMEPAFNVGGDFYDFYLLNEDKIMFLVADVSGKGVPAALFMMTAKTIVKDITQYVDDMPYAFKSINDEICTNNKHNLFVTMIAGVMDLKNNKLALVNCGHNLPLIKRKNGDFEYIELESNMVLGAMPDMNFEVKEIDFNFGDEIFFYTDGITEAMDKNSNLYSEQRLKDVLNKNKNLSIENICKNIKADVNAYSCGIEQSDDITMLLFKYYGRENIYRNTASKENYKRFNMWLYDNMEKLNINTALRPNIELAFEEIYTNIFSYAYSSVQGEVEISIEKNNDDIILKFKDWGTPYNPLEKPDPDIGLAPDKRSVGGLGVYMVKQLSKDIEYNWDSANILTVKF
ncbi:MAG: SpoIIE family protein phosphatase [Candidatus Gastranaerophilales bacterium]|nr:SpoIIE family protein phosphatase [Candidatus Gastranaerophilales bacterium]